MTDFRQKRDGVAASDAEFCRGLEELFRGHLDGCMSALASCSSVRGGDSDDDDSTAAEGSDLVARRRRRSEIDGDDLAESSAARRRHSRILSRWVARQAEEMITTMERRNRESELMALAGMHTVSMLDSSFLREPRRSTSSEVERPGSARAFSILQRWRELEDEAGRRERRGLGDGRVEERREARMDASESDENDYGQWARGEGMTPRAPRQDEEDNNRSSREQSPDLGEVERERVRQIVRGWITERGLTDHGAPITPQRNESPRAEWLGETERERVRLVREWVQMASEQGEVRAGRREEHERDRDRDRDREGEHGSRESSVTDHEDGQPEHVRRDLLRIRGRQARLDLIMRVARERQRELQGLSEHRAVSEFAHRSRIQSFLRGRFLRNGRTPEDERPPSVAARELGQLRQRHPVSGLREGFRYRLESIVRSQASNHSETSTRNQNVSAGEQSQLNAVPEAASGNNEQFHPQNEENDIHRMEEIQNIDLEENTNVNIVDQLESTNQEGRWQVENMEHDRGDWERTTEVGVSEWNGQHREDSVGNWHDVINQEWPQELPENGIDEGSGSPEAHEDWREDESNLAAEQWQDDNSEPSRNDQPASIRRVNTFIPPDDENVYSTELRELLSRRSVSNLLSSGFRESLDQLIQSYVQRQGRGPMDWNRPQNVQNPELPEEVRDEQRYDPGRNQQDAVPRAPRVLPVPPVPPPQPIWHQDMRHSNWTRNNMHRSEIEWDVINDLRADMAKLQQGMNHMQRMLEACMDMQLELQRSVRQEVSAALNRNFTGQGDVAESSDGSKWSHVRKGTCCVCCDAQIDSLLYRCGHMCTCSKCANELVQSGGKCPLCRAPIVEVIRAYCIL